MREIESFGAGPVARRGKYQENWYDALIHPDDGVGAVIELPGDAAPKYLVIDADDRFLRIDSVQLIAGGEVIGKVDVGLCARTLQAIGDRGQWIWKRMEVSSVPENCHVVVRFSNCAGGACAVAVGVLEPKFEETP